MKKPFFLTFALLCLFVSVNAQVMREADVPAPVKTKMSSMFPDANAVVWKHDMPGFVTADFVRNKNKMSATFTTSGSWVSTATTVKQEDFPAPVNQYLLTTYQDGKISQCVLAESVKEKTYECRVKSKTAGEYDLVFDTTGNLKMKTVAEKE
jgi:hypothetical protein